MTARRPVSRRLLLGLAPFLLIAAALPLLAPTCGGGTEGWRTFSRSSLIIPMDRCWQNQTDGVTPGTVAGCSAPQAGDVIKAYGLVYQLIRNDVAVYWVISPDKTSLTGQDLMVQYTGGFPVMKLDWASGQPGAGLGNANHQITYMGGPFIVDGADYAKAVAVLQKYQTTFSGVNVHVANVAFRGYVKKTMAGGWSAGGTTAPKLALLDIGSGNISATNPLTIRDPKNAQPVISGYLAKAGIGSGTAAGTATGPHGEIYDRLTIEDFQPAAGSTDWRTSRLYTNGYQILWVPHWVAPGSCSDYSSAANCAATVYPQAKIDQVLKTIGAFVASGNDLFAECAGMGSFEGAFKAGSTSPTGYTIDYQDGDPTTRFQTKTGLRYNELPNNPFPAPSYPGTNFGSPFLQLGDFPFAPVTGAIEDARPQGAAAGGGYVDAGGGTTDVVRLITGTKSTASPEVKTRYGDSYDLFDYFTLRPAVKGSHGTIVYLSGHSYSGVQGSFEVAGSRLVLNTLFNLGAGCTNSGVSCDTGLLGVCAKGVLTCDANGQSVCTPVVRPGERQEVCNGLDDDCNGLVDENLETTCYDGPGGTSGVGLCRPGVSACERKPDGSYGMSACVGEVLPQAEVCNGLDDNCNGQVDEQLQQGCYEGPLSTLDAQGRPMGVCKAGLQACSNGSWGACAVCPDGIKPGDPGYANCQILPGAEVCIPGQAVDANCDGQIDEATPECGVCTTGQSRTCYTGPGGTVNVGICHAGHQDCSNGTWSPCLDEQLPQTEVCTAAGGTAQDENCDGRVDEGCSCPQGPTKSCHTFPDANLGKGVCAAGTQTCVNGDYGACIGQVQPSPEICNGKDDDCNGLADDGATCANGFDCVNGVCITKTCGVETPCPEGYRCDVPAGATAGTCKVTGCGTAHPTGCPAGQQCQFGACVDPCDKTVVSCAPGSTCSSGSCTGGSCYFTGCPSGQVCLQGACAPDKCAGVACPAGTFCREGDCVQSCAFVSCRNGEKCGQDGFCESDPCAGKACKPNELCEATTGKCVSDPCAGLSCGQGQVCSGGTCVDDPCTGVTCPAGQCLGGQCFPAGNPEVVTTPMKSTGGGGCGCGTGAATPLGALLALLALPLARRRRRGAAAGPAGRGLLVLALAALSLLGSACQGKGSDVPDLSKCEVTCEGVNRCVDVWTDASNCGYCGNACGAGNVCVDKVCGPSSGVAPFVTKLTPTSGAKGTAAAVEVDISGQRFDEGATVRAVIGDQTVTYPTRFVSASSLKLQLDLSALPATTAFLRVVNPDRVISNVVRFDVTTPTPSITAIAPASVLTGTVTDLVVSGSGFLPDTRCWADGTTLAAQALPTAVQQDGTLRCTFDASSLAPAVGFHLWAVNPSSPDPLPSAKVAFDVRSAVPVVADVSPGQAASGEAVAFTVNGDGFDVTSQVLFGSVTPPPLTTFVSAHQLYVASFKVPTCASGASCPYEIHVRNGSGMPSTTFATFLVGAPPPGIAGLSPGSAYQGATGVTLTFTGSGFPTGTKIQLQPPNGTFATLGSSAVNGTTQVSATTDFVNQPAGTWSVRLAYPTPTAGVYTFSAAYPFRLLSNTATLVGSTSRGDMQGKSVPVILSATNLRPSASVTSADKGIRVLFAGSTLTPTGVTITSAASGTGSVSATLSTGGMDTGTYTLQVVNPNADPSNYITFNVTPGPPTLATVSPGSATQGDTPTVITLTGTNFAKPDASGNGQSIVHISAPSLGITDYAIPAAVTTVVDAKTIKVTFDTRTGVAGSYDVSVWNPGGPTPPQKSNTLAGAFTIQ